MEEINQSNFLCLVFIRSNSKVNRQKMSSAKDKSIDATSEQIIRRLFGISKKHK